ncbi:sugar kinase [Aliiroseovarius sp. 2305UL8-7]|uniref:sugar kinase n=1 Tax=Aliiroseovarius conchicola TaxID=3121637 RepID=UPI0035295CE9
MRKRIVFAGEVMGELRHSESDGDGFAVGFAGDSFNAAVYCKRCLGSNGEVAYQTRIGHDPLSAGALALAKGEQLDTEAIRYDASRNLGLYAVKTDAAGERSFFYWREHSAARTLFQDPKELDVFAQADIIYLSGITLAIIGQDQRNKVLDKVAQLRASDNVAFAFDSNYRPKLWENVQAARETVSRAWSITDIALPSVDDEMALFEEADEQTVLARLRTYGLTQGALKRGSLGPVSLDPAQGDNISFPAAKTVVDTTAAGDSFNGGFLAALLQGAPASTCMKAGHDLACEVVGQPGAITPRT